MKLPAEPNLPTGNSLQALAAALVRFFRLITTKVNSIAEGRISGFHNATTSAPTTGDYRQGDFVRNSAPTEQGAAGNKYIIHGWQCVVSGSPGTWVECRYLTGN